MELSFFSPCFRVGGARSGWELGFWLGTEVFFLRSFLFDLDEFHGFPEVCEYVSAFRCYFVECVAALFFGYDEFLFDHGFEDFH